MIKIITDSSSNISQEEAKALGVTVVPLGVSFGLEQYLDGVDLTAEQFYAKLTEGKEFPHSSQPSEEYLTKLFEEESRGADEVLALFLSAELSGTHSLAVNVVKRTGLKNVRVYNTLATTTILRTLVLEALKYKDKTADEAVAALDDLRPRIKLYAALDTLEYLRKGGRLSGVASFIGGLLKIKPVISHDTDGKIKLVSKQIGFQLALKGVADRVKSADVDLSYPVYYLYTKDDANCNSLIEKLGLPVGEKLNVCPVIGTHIGPGGAGVMYVEKKA